MCILSGAADSAFNSPTGYAGRRLRRVNESDLDILIPAGDDAVYVPADGALDSQPRPQPGWGPSALGFVGVSVGFATLVGLCAALAVVLWLALFGRSLLLPLALIFGSILFPSGG